jgi:predicted pyridoxine 5'-phosphate oxidase superfamily flavin-nucleotide-binding protein
MAFAPARIAMRVLHRPTADVAKPREEESPQTPQFVPAGSRRDDASPNTTPRAADTRGPLHATMCRLQRRHNAAA